MSKRIALLIGVALILGISAAPDAMASHCERCKWYPIEGEYACIPATGLWAGNEICQEGGWWCEQLGNQCVPHGSLAPLSSEFTVASVERLDEPKSGADETLVATAEIR